MNFEQLDFLEAPKPISYPPHGSKSIQERFESFHRANPWIYNHLTALARDMLRYGRTKLGIKMLWEVMRWNYFKKTSDPNSEFKLCNDYTSRYARLIQSQEPDLANIFELREIRSK